jgi:hypothetical protein
MATNKLMEAAAEILASSKSSAPGMPMPKLQHDTPGNSGTPEDLGGPTPQNNKPSDDSNKLSNKAKDSAGSNKSSLNMKPSSASADVQLGDKNMKYGTGTAMMPEEEHKKGKDVEDEEDDDDDEVEKMKEKMKEDIDSLFADDKTISEDFKSRAATIFEARVFDRVAQIQEQLEAEYAGQLVEAVEVIKQELTEKVDDYLNYVVEQWMDDNEIAVESGLRSEITEDFIAGLRNLFAENYINVPEDKVDLVEELASKVEELEEKLNEEIETNIQYKKQLTEAVKVQLVNEVCEGLTATQVEKIKALAESVEFSTEEEFVEKLETIRENYFPSGMKKANAAQLHETVDDTDGNDKKVSSDPYVASVMQAISKTKI